MANTSSEKKPTLLGTIFSPVRQFQRISQKPAFWLAFITFVFLSSWLLGANEYYVVKQPEYSQILLSSFPPEQRDQVDVKAIQMNSMSYASLGGFFGGILLPLLGAFLLWIWSKLVKGAGTFRHYFSFQVHLFSIYILSFLFQLLMTMAFNQASHPLSLSLAFLVPGEGVFKQVLGMLDLFTIWVAVLLGIGLKIIAKVSDVKAWSVPVIFLLMVIGLALASS